MAPREHRLELSPRPASAAEARRFVEDALAGIDDATRQVGVLLVSELVTNAVLYAQGRITVRVVQTPDAFRVVVRDPSAQEIRPREVGLDATSGRGLALVDRLSAAWGVDVIEQNGKEVWFEVPRSA